MDNIEEIYAKDIYYPFLLYCQEKKYVTMQDLTRCSFDSLAIRPDMTPLLLIRIKGLYAAYCKSHPDLLLGRSQPKPKASARIAPSLEEQLRSYFEVHTNTLVRAVDISKDLRLKRNDVIKTLQQAPWCKAVDASTFFYAGEAKA